ncbi:3'(2'),5'-bisphosphate nucleotidase CysQ [Knoellia sp. CPCC 206453]|uniref:3'(2'),5'-bisphosphate nucleotidase CysQ n=1 Tax=Knoellia pratensis TaxID=3404796 RepID=UPI00361419CB
MYTGTPHSGELAADHVLARDLAQRAGDLLVGVRASWAGDRVGLKAAGDRKAHEFLAAALARHRPDDGILSEEGPDDPSRLVKARVWIVDPLDGTREFSEVPRDDWAVHVALVVDGRVVAGAVARPARGDVLATDDPPTVPERASGPLRLAVSRTRPPPFVKALADHLGADLVPMGSAGIKATSVVDGVVDAYVHAGGQYEWDSAAPVGVALSAGLRACRIDGSELTYNHADPLLPDLLIARPEFAGIVLDAISTIERGRTQ